MELEGAAAGHVRSNKGVELKVAPPTRPKLGEELPSNNVYQYMLVLPLYLQATSSQYVLAFASDGIARLELGPLTGKPVSVIHTGLPWAAATVAE